MIMSPILQLLLACSFIVINRIRGGGFKITNNLPGHPRFTAIVLSAIVASILLPWQAAIIWSATYAAWTFLPHGRWMTLYRHPRENTVRQPSWFEIAVEKIAGKNDYIALGLKNAIFAILLIPSLYFVEHDWIEPAALVVFAPLSVWAYATGWRIVEENSRISDPLCVAELLQGAIFGMTLFFLL